MSSAKSLGFAGVFVTVDTPNTGNREQTFGDPGWVSELTAKQVHKQSPCSCE